MLLTNIAAGNARRHGLLLYFPNPDATMVFRINYGTGAESALQDTYFRFQDEIADIIL